MMGRIAPIAWRAFLAIPLLSAVPVGAADEGATRTAAALEAEESAPSEEGRYESDEEWGFVTFAAILLIGTLIFLGLGVVLGLAALAILLILTSLGIASSTALIAILTRRPKTTLRWLLVQLGAAAGAVLGLLVGLLGAVLFDQTDHLLLCVAGGALAGLFGGVAVAVLAVLALEYAYGLVSRRKRP